MNKIKTIFLIFLTASFLFSINNTNAKTYKKNEIPFIINKILQKVDSEKKEKLLINEKVINFIKNYPKVFINSFVYKVISTRTYNNYKIENNNLSFNYNKLNILNPTFFNIKKEQIREFIILELIKTGKLNIDKDVKWYYLDTNLKWELIVKKNNIKIDKKDLIKEYIDSIFVDDFKDIKYISNNYNTNIYYNYLRDNNIKRFKSINIDLDKLKNSLIIRNVKDFKKMFKVTSYRYRSWYKYDPSYRKYNIAQIYNTIPNNKLVLYPKQTISFNSIYLKWDNWKKFKYWSVILKWKVEDKVYWWWVCWAATWMYQWSLYNKYIKTNARNHSFWYNMYRASINWQKIYTPWLDATYYTNVIDLNLTNVWDYPIILVNRIVDNIEENFTLSMTYVKDDKIPKIQFIKNSSLYNKDKEKTHNCYTWKINWKYRYSCYKDKEYAKKQEEKKK